MVQVKKNMWGIVLCFFTIVMIGVLLGAVGVSVLVSYRMDVYMRQIRHLQTVIQDKDIKLQRLQESINRQRFILKDLEVNLICKGDEMDKMEIEKHIRDKYSSLLGKEVKDIDMEMVEKVIDQRIFRLESGQYKLHVSKILLAEVMKIWVSVSPVEAE